MVGGGGVVVGTAGIAWSILKAAVGIRVGEEEEISGFDPSELGMEAYPEVSKG